MEDFLIQLNLEKDYDHMMVLLLDKDGLKNVKNYFIGLNSKVLLSSFLIKNFYEYFLLTENDELVKVSKVTCNFIMNQDLENTQKNYKNFYDLFVQWRDHDIRGMKEEIQSAKGELEGMMTEDEPVDDAEVQWNEGVKINMKLMDSTMKMLDIYGKTPPKL